MGIEEITKEKPGCVKCPPQTPAIYMDRNEITYNYTLIIRIGGMKLIVLCVAIIFNKIVNLK